MSPLSNQTVLDILEQYDRKNHVQASPRAGHLRVFDVNNDVFCAIENMGGMAEACRLLAVTPDDIETWIDNYYVPAPFLAIIQRHTGFSRSVLQTSTLYVLDQGKYWPHEPSADELIERNGRGILRRIQPSGALNKKSGTRGSGVSGNLGQT